MPDNQYAIRKATNRDATALLDLMKDLAKFEGYDKGFKITEDILKERGFDTNKPQFTAFVAEDKSTGALVGMAVTYKQEFHFSARPKLIMKELLVKEEYRSQGIGEQLIGAVCREGVEQECCGVGWTVANWNKGGQKFYNKVGATADHEWINYGFSEEVMKQNAQAFAQEKNQTMIADATLFASPSGKVLPFNTSPYRKRPGEFAFDLPSSEPGRVFAKAAHILEERQNEKGYENTDIIDLSQGDPTSEPLDIVKNEIKRVLDYEPLGKYRFNVVSQPFLVSVLRYITTHGVDYKTLVKAAPDNFYKDKEMLAENLRTIDRLLWDGDIRGQNLFLAHYYHDIVDEQHEPFLHDGEAYNKERLIRQLQETNPSLNLAKASEKLQNLTAAIKSLKIIGGTENCKAAFGNSIRMFKGKYVLGGSGIYQAFSDLPSDMGKSWEIIDTTDSPHYKLMPVHLQAWIDKNPEKTKDINCVAIADPSNPMGGVYSKEELQELVDFCRAKRIPIVSDSVYSGIEIHEGLVSTPVTELYPEGSIAFKSMGKTFSSPGLRIGFAYGNPEFIERFNAHTRNLTGFLPVVADIGAAAIMEYTPESYYQKNNELYAQRMRFVKERVSKINIRIKDRFGPMLNNRELIVLSEPQGGYFIQVNMPFLKGMLFPYRDPDTNEEKIGVVNGSMDVTRMFIHYTDEQRRDRGVRLPPTTSQAVPDSKLQVRISVGRDSEEMLGVALDRIENIIVGTLSKQHTLRRAYNDQKSNALHKVAMY